MIPEMTPTVDWAAILHGAIARAAERAGVTPELIALYTADWMRNFRTGDHEWLRRLEPELRKELMR